MILSVNTEHNRDDIFPVDLNLLALAESQIGLGWKAPKRSPSSNPLWSGTPYTRPGCPAPHPASP